MNPLLEDVQSTEIAKKIKATMQSICILSTEDIKTIYQNLSQYDPRVLEQTATCIKVELLGAATLKLRKLDVIRRDGDGGLDVAI